MTPLHRLALLALALAFVSCTSKEQAQEAAKQSPSPVDLAEKQPEVHGTEIKSVALSKPLDQAWVAAGQGIYDTKCAACHRLSGERLVGPTWAGVTQRRKPEWILNMITNVEMMLETDPEAQKQLEQCLVRMPNQNVTEPDARKILEFMRKNDGEI
jgi:mono/diheme cytochrome c family protein